MPFSTHAPFILCRRSPCCPLLGRERFACSPTLFELPHSAAVPSPCPTTTTHRPSAAPIVEPAPLHTHTYLLPATSLPLKIGGGTPSRHTSVASAVPRTRSGCVEAKRPTQDTHNTCIVHTHSHLRLPLWPRPMMSPLASQNKVRSAQTTATAPQHTNSFPCFRPTCSTPLLSPTPWSPLSQNLLGMCATVPSPYSRSVAKFVCASVLHTQPGMCSCVCVRVPVPLAQLITSGKANPEQ